jgi:hypothetical protein
MLVKNVLRWNPKLSIGIIVLINFYHSTFFSQKKSENQPNNFFRHSVFFTQSLQKFDNFSVLNYCVTRNKFFCTPSFGVGVNRTFYQQRFFPQFQVGFGCKVLCFKKMTISPEINVIFSTFSTIERHYFSSLQAGYLFQYGNKIFLVHRLNAGLLNERFKNTLGSISSANTIDWQFSLGIGYAIN